jgi:hypothetical protein
MNYLPIQLPSQCLTYKDINPEQIKIRNYVGSDEIMLCQITPINIERSYLMVLQNIIQGIDPKRLTLGDRLFIMIWEYANSYSNTVNVKTICESCLEEITIPADLNKLKAICLPDTYKEPYEKKLPSGKTILLKILTVEDEIEVEKWKDQKEAPLYRLARSIVSKDDVLKVLDDLKSMPAKDVASIRAFHQKMFHGYDMNLECICPKCGAKEFVEVPFRLEFIFPTGKALGEYFGEGV